MSRYFFVPICDFCDRYPHEDNGMGGVSDHRKDGGVYPVGTEPTLVKKETYIYIDSEPTLRVWGKK